MERSRYGEERRVKRVRISSSAYLSSNDDDDDDETSIGASKRSPCQKNKTADSSVGTHQVVKVTKVVGKKALFEDDGSEKVAKKECSVAVRYTLTLCEECAHGDAADEMLLCDKCDRGFHMFCLSPILVTVPPGDWICPHCSQSTTALEFQMVQKRIVDYFSMQRFLPSNQEMEAREVKRQRGRPPSGPRLLPHVPTADVHRRLEQMASLAAALTSIGVDFCDSLNYGYAPRTANRAAHEKGGMREMPKDDKETVSRCKMMCKRGEWQPLMVTYDLRQGFVVEADEDIKNMTFIAEYTGEVDYMCCRHYDSGNSIMGLLFSDDPLKELVICPDRKGNIARFLSGINNHTEEGRSKQNVRCVRYSINGEARVILIAMRDIRKGERLYYDYNAYCMEYPTEHFV